MGDMVKAPPNNNSENDMKLINALNHLFYLMDKRGFEYPDASADAAVKFNVSVEDLGVAYDKTGAV